MLRTDPLKGIYGFSPFKRSSFLATNPLLIKFALQHVHVLYRVRKLVAATIQKNILRISARLYLDYIYTQITDLFHGAYRLPRPHLRIFAVRTFVIPRRQPRS